MREVWKNVIGFESRYQVSNLGNVKSLPKKWYFNNGGYRNYKGKILKLRISNVGYYYVCLGHEPMKLLTIHRLVAKAFIANPENKKFVNHIDGNKLNNNVNNLEWVTMQENFDHAIKIGLTNKGEKVANHVLTDKKVKEMRRLYKSNKGWTYKKLANKFGCCESNIGYVIKNIYWSHI